MLAAALAWALNDPLLVQVDLLGERAAAHVEDGHLLAQAGAPPSGEVALYLESTPRSPQDPALQRAVRALAAPLLWLDADAGWQRITAYDEGKVLWSRDFASQGLGGWLDRAGSWFRAPTGEVTSAETGFLAGGDAAQRYDKLEAIVQRAANTIGVVVGGDGTSGGLLLLVRPVHRDILFWNLRDGAWEGPLGGTIYLRPWYSALKNLVRLFLRPYFFAFALVAIAAALGLLVDLATQRTRASRAMPLLSPLFLWERDRVRASSSGAGEPVTAIATSRIEAMTLPSWVAWPTVTTLAIAAFGLGGIIADPLLQRMPHVQDSVAYYFQAQVFARGALWSPAPPLPEFFVHEFVVMHDGHWFGRYPPGWSAILALGVIAGVPWLVSPLLLGVAVLVTYALGSRTAGRGVGLVGALFLATSPFALILSGEYMAHVPGLMLGTLFALCYVAADRRPSWMLAAGLAIGMAFLVRPYTAVCLAAPFGVDMLLQARRGVRPAVLRIVLLGLGVAPMMAIYLAYNWVMAGSPLASTMDLWWSVDKMGFGPDRGIGGHTPLNGLYNTVKNTVELSRHAFGWPAIASFALAFMPFAAGRSTRWDRLWLASWLCLIGGYFFWWADGTMYGPRFYLETMGFLALLSARGLFVLADVGRWPGAALASLLATVLLLENLVIYLPGQLGSMPGYNFVSRARIDVVERAGVHNAVVYVDPGPTPEWWNYGMVFSANSPWLDTDIIYARDLGTLDQHLVADYPDRRHYRLIGQTLVELTPGS